jgi:hypothetical protein
MRRLAILKNQGRLFLIAGEPDWLNQVKQEQCRRLLTKGECDGILMILNRQRWTRPTGKEAPIPRIFEKS